MTKANVQCIYVKCCIKYSYKSSINIHHFLFLPMYQTHKCIGHIKTYECSGKSVCIQNEIGLTRQHNYSR